MSSECALLEEEVADKRDAERVTSVEANQKRRGGRRQEGKKGRVDLGMDERKKMLVWGEKLKWRPAEIEHKKRTSGCTDRERGSRGDEH